MTIHPDTTRFATLTAALIKTVDHEDIMEAARAVRDELAQHHDILPVSAAAYTLGRLPGDLSKPAHVRYREIFASLATLSPPLVGLMPRALAPQLVYELDTIDACLYNEYPLHGLRRALRAANGVITPAILHAVGPDGRCDPEFGGFDARVVSLLNEPEECFYKLRALTLWHINGHREECLKAAARVSPSPTEAVS